MIIISNFTVSIIINRFIFFKHRNFKSHNFHAKDNIKQDTVDFVAKFIGKKKKEKRKIFNKVPYTLERDNDVTLARTDRERAWTESIERSNKRRCSSIILDVVQNGFARIKSGRVATIGRKNERIAWLSRIFPWKETRRSDRCHETPSRSTMTLSRRLLSPIDRHGSFVFSGHWP